MWRWTLMLLLAVALGVVSIGCPREEPVIPPPDMPPVEDPAEPLPPVEPAPPEEPAEEPEEPEVEEDQDMEPGS